MEYKKDKHIYKTIISIDGNDKIKRIFLLQNFCFSFEVIFDKYAGGIF